MDSSERAPGTGIRGSTAWTFSRRSDARPASLRGPRTTISIQRFHGWDDCA